MAQIYVKCIKVRLTVTVERKGWGPTMSKVRACLIFHVTLAPSTNATNQRISNGNTHYIHLEIENISDL